MGNRTVSVTLTAQVAGYLAGMEQVKRKTKETSDEAHKRLASQGAAYIELGSVAMKAGALASAGIALAIVRFAQFDQAISNVKAATQESAENMGLLREAALDAGASTVFTATEAANAIEELGKTGLSTAQILNGGLDGALSLASAGQLEVARAAEIASISMKQFGLTGADIPRIADLLAAGAGKAAGDVEDLAQALAQSGLVANQTGLSIEETTGVLSAFADAGLLGSDAGTSLKTALQRLTPQSKEAKDEMDRLGISAYDAQGNFIGISKFSGVLQSSLKDLTAEQRNASLGIIFGSDAVRAAAVLYEQGADGIQKYVDQTNDSGYAAKVAADRLDNLAGDVEKLGGAFDTALIRSGSGANDVLRSLTQSATFLVDTVGDLPEPVLNTALALGTATTATLLAGGAALTAQGRWQAFKATLDGGNVSLKTAAARAGGFGGAIALATIVIGAFVAEQAKSEARVDSFRDSLDQATGAVTQYTRDMVIAALEEKKAFSAAEKYGVTQKELTDAVLEGGDALDVVTGKLDAAGEGLTGNQKRAADLKTEYGTTSIAIRTVSDELAQSIAEYNNTEAANDGLSESLDGTAKSAGSATTEIASLAGEIREFYGLALDAEAAASALEQAIDDATDSFAENGSVLDINAQAGRDNRDALRDVAQAAQDAAAAALENGAGADAASAAMQRGRDALEELRLKYGLSTEDVQLYNDALSLTPEQIATQMQLNGIDDASAKLQSYKDLLNSITQSGNVVGIPVNTNQYTYLQVPKKADGGAISGPGTGTSDTAGLYRLSNGEHVLTASDVARMGGQAGVYALRQSLYGGYANGGAVQYAPPSPYGSSGPSSRTSIVQNWNVVSDDPYTAAEIAAQRSKASLRGVGA